MPIKPAFFDYPEHDIIGKTLSGYFKKYFRNQPNLSAGKVKLVNGEMIEISKIYALIGDFFAIPDSPISGGATLEERKQRFLAVFNLLNNADPLKLKKILKIGEIQEEAVNKALERGEDPHEAIKKVANETNRLWNEATGGGYFTYPILQGEYLKIQATNVDHFADSAKKSYEAGHELALDIAKQAAKLIAAGESPDSDKVKKLIEQAVALEAGAGHYLTDAFSSGHVRTPRKELNDLWTPSALSGLLAYYMHHEEGERGVWVKNDKGQIWQTFGDGSLLNPYQKDNQDKVKEAASIGMLEVISVIQNALKSDEKFPEIGTVYKLFPKALSPAQKNTYPLFKVGEDGTLLRREDVSNPECDQYTKWWTVAGTLGKLVYYFGLPGSEKETQVQQNTIIDNEITSSSTSKILQTLGLNSTQLNIENQIENEPLPQYLQTEKKQQNISPYQVDILDINADDAYQLTMIKRM